jgi:phage gpG-like protein
VRYYAEIFGDKIVERNLQVMGRSALDARPALNRIADIIMDAVDMNFESQGRRGGGSWKRVSPGWQARKVREGLDPRIGHATLALRDSMTSRRDPDNVTIITRQRLSIGSNLVYAEPQNVKRPFTTLIEPDMVRIRRTLINHLMRAWRKRTRVAK